MWEGQCGGLKSVPAAALGDPGGEANKNTGDGLAGTSPSQEQLPGTRRPTLCCGKEHRLRSGSVPSQLCLLPCWHLHSLLRTEGGSCYFPGAFED